MSHHGTEFQKSLGLTWSAVPGHDGGVAVEMAMRDDLRGPAGTLEGGIVSTLVDVAGASAAARSLGGMVATESLTVSFLAPGRDGPIRATAVVLRSNNGGAVADVRVVDTGHDDRLMAVAQVAVRALPPRGPVVN
jgi:uncharacterized protein (TIGR00369 family)